MSRAMQILHAPKKNKKEANKTNLRAINNQMAYNNSRVYYQRLIIKHK